MVDSVNKPENAGGMQKSKPSVLQAVFLLGFAIFAIIGNLINGVFGEPVAKGFFAIFYLTIPNLFGTVLGLPLAEGSGWFFTFLASLFFLVISIALYRVRIEDAFSDFVEGTEGGVRRTLQFLAALPYLSMVAGCIIDNNQVLSYLEKPFLLIFPMLLFVVYIIIMFAFFSEDKNCITKRNCRFLAAIGFMLAVSGFSHLILEYGIGHSFVLTSKLTALFVDLNAVVYAMPWCTLLLLGIQCILLITALVSLLMFVRCNSECSFTALGGFSVVYIQLWKNSNANGIVSGQTIKFWVFLLILAILWSSIAVYKSKRLGWLSLISCILLEITALTWFTSLEAFYPSIIETVGELVESLLPLQNRLTTWVLNTVNFESLEGEWSIAVASAILLVATGLIYFFAYRKFRADANEIDTLTGNPQYAKICSHIFLIGVLILCTEKDWPFLDWVAYYLCLIPMFGGIIGVIMCCVNHDRLGLAFQFRGFIVTVILSIIVSLFSPIIGVLLIALLIVALIAYIILATSEASVRTKGAVIVDRLMNALQGAAVAQKIDDYRKLGGDSSVADAVTVMAADVFGERDDELKKELEEYENK